MNEAMNYKLPPLPDLGPEWTAYWTKVVHEKMQAYAIAAIEAQASVVQQEPVAWMWKNTKTDAEGVYLEDPATIGIELNHPAYQWTLLYTHPAQQAPTPCNCRWDGEKQVQQCTMHEAHIDAIHEWAERAKAAEAKLLAPQASVVQQEPVADIKISGDDFDLGLTDAFAFGRLRLPDGHYLLYTHTAQQAKPQPLSADRDARIAELEQRNRDLYEDVQRFKEHALSEKDARMALEQELAEVRKDAERWKMTVEIGQDVLRHPMSRKIPESVSAYMDAIHKGFDMTHAIDAAIGAAMKGTP